MDPESCATLGPAATNYMTKNRRAFIHGVNDFPVLFFYFLISNETYIKEWEQKREKCKKPTQKASIKDSYPIPQNKNKTTEHPESTKGASLSTPWVENLND